MRRKRRKGVFVQTTNKPIKMGLWVKQGWQAKRAHPA